MGENVSEKQEDPIVITVLEIGSSNVSLTSAFCFNNRSNDFNEEKKRFQVIFHRQINTTCVIGGFPVDLKQFREKIEQLKYDCERVIEREILEVFIIFSSTLIRYHHLSEGLTLRNSSVTLAEVDKLISQVKQAKNFSTNVPIYFSSLTFSLDNQTKIENPIGLKGKHLEVHSMAMSLPEFNVRSLFIWRSAGQII